MMYHADMDLKEFDTQLQNVCMSMGEAVHELLDYDDEAIDAIYVYGSMEDGNTFFNTFCKIYGKIAKISETNSYFDKKYDLSDERVFGLLEFGDGCLLKVIGLFNEDDREVPTLLKLTYEPKIGATSTDISYDKHLSIDPPVSNSDGFKKWLEETKSSIEAH